MFVVPENSDPEEAHVLIVGSVSESVITSLFENGVRTLVAATIKNAKNQLSLNTEISVVVANLDSASVEFLTTLRKEKTLLSLILCLNTTDTNTIVQHMNACRPDHCLKDIAELSENIERLQALIAESKLKRKTQKDKQVSSYRDSIGSRIPTLHSQLSNLVHRLEKDLYLTCLYIDLSRLRPIESELGISLHSNLFLRAGTELKNLRGNKLRGDDLICRTGDSDGFICFTGPSRYSPNEASHHENLAARINTHLNQELANAMRGLTSILPQVTIGSARVLENPMVRGERLVMRLVKEAKESAELSYHANKKVRKSEIQDLIIQKKLRPVFQPIVDMDTAEIFAFEALTRGPIGSTIESPKELFGVAEAVNLTLELDRACFRSALDAAVGFEPIHRLFVNLLPQSFHDDRFIAEEVIALLETASLTPANLVFEITEKLAIDNFSAFKQALGRYTDMGFGVAVDDVGTQHSNLESLMALQPHFIKLSDILCRGVSKSTVKREMVRSLQRIAETIDAVTVAEGIEDIEDVKALRDLGIRFGQGYYFCRPCEGFSSVSTDVKDAVGLLAPRQMHDGAIGTPEPHDEFLEQTETKINLQRASQPTGVWKVMKKKSDPVDTDDKPDPAVSLVEES